MSAIGRVRDTCRGNKFRIIVSDVCQAIAIFLVIISVAVGTAKPTPNYSWARGYVNVPYKDGTVHKMTINFGLTHWVQCVNDVNPGSEFYGCNSYDLGTIENSSCKAAGSGSIAAATFAMLFGLISIFFLHAEANGKTVCGRRIPWPRTILFVFSFLSLLLYIVVVATWYEKCYNSFLEIIYFPKSTNSQNIHDGAAGYAVATAIAAIVFSFLSWAFAFWRSCRPNRAEGEAGNKQPNGGVARSSSESVLAYAAPHMTPGNIAAAASIAGPIAAQQYGNAYSSNTAYSNDEPEGQTAYGGSSGGYGGSYGGGASQGGYGGAYGGGNEGSYGSGGKQQGAYGY